MISDLPRRYLGGIVGNGYIIPADPNTDEHQLYVRVMGAADNGDETAQAILLSLPLTKYESTYTSSKYGVALHYSRDNTVLQLRHSHYPKSFSGKCLPQLQHHAQQGRFTASRLVAEIARARMLNPEFQLIDNGG